MTLITSAVICGAELFGSKSVDWVYGGSAARGDIARQQRGGGQADGDGDVRHRVHRADTEENGGHEAHQDQCGDEATSYPYSGENQSVANEHIGEDPGLSA